MLLQYLRKRELGSIKQNDKENIYKYLDLICKKRIQENEFELYKYLFDISKYEFIILIDGDEIKEINSHSHEIKIYFKNNIRKEKFLVKKLNLNKVGDELYNFFDNDGNIQFENKSIIANTIYIKEKDIDIEDKEIIYNITNYKPTNWYKHKIKYILIFFILFLIISVFKNSNI